MSNNTKIEWAGMSWPLVTGCTYAGESCLDCYAVRDSWRLAGNPNPKVSEPYSGIVKKVLVAGKWLLRWTNTVKIHPDRLEWVTNRQKPRRVFVSNMGDLFHKNVPDWFIDRAFDRMEKCPQHKFLVLTKRGDRMAKYVADRQPLSNVMLGISAGTKKELIQRGSEIISIKGWQLFLSLEPLLEPIDWELAAVLDSSKNFVWVVCGGQSSKKQSDAKRCEIDWLTGIVGVCGDRDVACFVKQLGGYLAAKLNLTDRKGCDWEEWNCESLKVREYEDVVADKL